MFLGFRLFVCLRYIIRIRCACILQLIVTAVEVVIVTAKLCRNEIHIFKPAYIIRTHKAVADTDCIGVHAALIIAAHQTVHIEFWEVSVLFFFQQKGL